MLIGERERQRDTEKQKSDSVRVGGSVREEGCLAFHRQDHLFILMLSLCIVHVWI